MSDYRCHDCGHLAPEEGEGTHDLTGHVEGCAGVARGVLTMDEA